LRLIMYVKDKVSAVLIGMLASGVGFVDDACGGPVYIGRYRDRISNKGHEVSVQEVVNTEGSGPKGEIERLKKEVQELKDEAGRREACQEEAQRKAALEESWKGEVYKKAWEQVNRETLGREGPGPMQGMDEDTVTDEESPKKDSGLGLHKGAVGEVQEGIIGRIALEVEKLKLAMEELTALVQKSIGLSKKLKAQRLRKGRCILSESECDEIEESGAASEVVERDVDEATLPDVRRCLEKISGNLSLDRADVKICNSPSVDGAPVEVTRFVNSLGDIFSKYAEGVVRKSKRLRDDDCVLKAGRFKGRSTVFLPDVVSAECVCPACSRENPEEESGANLDSTYKHFSGNLFKPGGILFGIKGGSGDSGQRDAIQDWVIENREVIESGNIVGLLEDLGSDNDLHSQYNLRWHFVRALIAASEEGDILYCNHSLHTVKDGSVDGGIKQIGPATLNPSEYGRNDGVGYVFKTFKALGILLSF
jgi:hypothetical protein